MSNENLQPEEHPQKYLQQGYENTRTEWDNKLRRLAAQSHGRQWAPQTYGGPTPSWEELYRVAVHERDRARKQLHALTDAIAAAQRATADPQ